MATTSLPQHHDDAPEYREFVRDATEDLNQRISGRRQDGADDALAFVYHEMVALSKKYSGSYLYLMVAIIAGERLLASSLLPNADLLSVRLSLAELLARRSRWDLLARFNDLKYAFALASEVLDKAESDELRIAALKKLSAFSEDWYERGGDEKQLNQAWSLLEAAAELTARSERDILLANAACLRFKSDAEALGFTLNMPDDQLSEKPVTWPAVAYKKFRFIDARHLASGKGLRVVEFDALPRQRYVALSYVWRGSYNAASKPTRTMSIEGAVGADPISIDVLITTAKCVETLGCELLWIDGVCIIQNDEVDKAWQIQRMFDLYRYCKHCLILPGGLSRLMPLDEPTSWIHRAWTLQEAVAPESCTVLFAWKHGNCILQTHMATYISDVVPGIAARTDLHNLLGISLKGRARIVKDPPVSDEPEEETLLRILVDDGESNQATALLGAIDYRDQEGLEGAILRASLMRVASRPADAVFSVMGILGVDLDPLHFDPNDRKGPTIALMQALLRQGKRAEWLGLAPHMDVNPEVPTLPRFPTIDEEGKAVVERKGELITISRAMGHIWWRLVGAPCGSMDDGGALSIRVPAMPTRKELTHKTLEIRPEGYSLWDDSPLGDEVLYPAPSQSGPPYIVKIGNIEQYLNGAQAVMPQSRDMLVMLIDKGRAGDERFRVLGYAEVGPTIGGLEGWKETEIVIAGTQSDGH